MTTVYFTSIAYEPNIRYKESHIFVIFFPLLIINDAVYTRFQEILELFCKCVFLSLSVG